MTKEEKLKESRAQLLAMEGMPPSQAVTLPNTEPTASTREAKEPESTATEIEESKPVEKQTSRFKKGIDPKNIRSLERKNNKLLVSLRDSDYAKLQQIAQSLEVSLNEAVAIAIDTYKIKKR